MPAFLELLPNWLWTSFAALLGACIGSFLNVAIYRLPRGLSVNKPSQSYCPACKQPIPWYRNLPVLTWLLQGGKAACCKERIPARYVIIELLTAALFALAWLYHYNYDTWQIGLALMPMLALLILGSAIDLEHMLLPDVTTIGGLILGLIVSAFVPALHGFSAHWWSSLKESLLGAGVGFALMISVWQLGKWAFGKQKIQLEKELPFSIQALPENQQHHPNPKTHQKLQFNLGSGKEQESLPLGQIFNRKSDQIIIHASSWELNTKQKQETHSQAKKSPTKSSSKLILTQTQLQSGNKTTPLEQIHQLSGKTKQLILPREAMGFGDVLLIAMLGSWCGWQGAIFSLAAGALLGLILALPARLLKTKNGEQSPLPFGPFLATAGVIWLFGGESWLQWYQHYLLQPLP